MAPLRALGIAAVAFFCVQCGGDDGSGGGGESDDGSGGSSGTGGSTTVPPACAARTPADDSFTPVVQDISVTGVVSDIFTDYFTGDVAIAEDVLVVGVPSWLSMVETDRAAVLVYRFDGQSFAFEQELLAAAPADPTSRFGDSVEISHTGQTVIVGNDRSAFIFRYDGEQWAGGEELAPRNEGDAIATVSVTDERAAVGYYKNGDLPGSVYVYRYDGASWVVEERIIDERFQSSSGTAAVIDGERLVIANRAGGGGFAYSFDGSAWVQTQQLGLSGSLAMQGDHFIGRNSNQVEIFEHDGTEWVNCGNEPCNDQCDISVYGSRIALGGAPSYSGTHFGHVYSFDGTEWGETHRTAFDARTTDIGRSFAVFGDEGFVEDQLEVVQIAPWP
jgi:hypothetical protein